MPPARGGLRSSRPASPLPTPLAVEMQKTDEQEKSIHRCIACGAPLFSPAAQLESPGTGFPTYYAPVCEERVATEERTSHGQRRTVVHCASCNARLGHLFDDDTQPTGVRYCIRHDALTDLAPNAA